MSLRYATIQNLQASGEAAPDSGEETTSGLGEGSQRKAYKDTNVANSHNHDLGVANTERLNGLNGLFRKTNIGLDDYDPLKVMVDTIDSNEGLNQNLDYGDINLNYDDARSFDLFDKVADADAKDKPQHGAPNVRVTPSDLINPNGERAHLKSPRRQGGFGTKYLINDIKLGNEKRQKIGTYLSEAKSIHRGGSVSRLGKSDPAGAQYTDSVIPPVEE